MNAGIAMRVVRAVALSALVAAGDVASARAAKSAATAVELKDKALALDASNTSRRLTPGKAVYYADIVHTFGKTRILLR